MGQLVANCRQIARDAGTPTLLFPALSSGLMVGLLIIVVELSLASLIFSGQLSAFATSAAGLTLFGTFVMCVVLSIGSSYSNSVCLPEDAPAAIMATISANVAAALCTANADPHVAFVTIGAAMTLSTLATAALFALLARYRLGNMVRYMPFPVVGGFLAGVGWMLVDGGFSIMNGMPLSFATLPALATLEQVARWAPGLLLALVLLWAMERWRNAFTLPLVLAGALGCFAVFLGVSQTSLAEAEQTGLLLGGMPMGSMLWPVFTLADASLIRWDALYSVLPQLLTIPLVSAISFFLIASGLEAAARVDINLKQDLYANAFANLLGGLGGAQAGYTALSFSIFGPATGSNSRLVGLTAGLLAAMATFFGASVLGYFPKFILGGMVLFIGLATMKSWVLESRSRVTPIEYCVLLAILGAIVWLGFLNGVGLGLTLATIVFVIKYSRIPVVRQDTNATSRASTRRRSVPDQHILREQAHTVRLLRVSGYLFFGSASSLGSTVAQHLEPGSTTRPAFLIIDFTDVDGFDSSAVNSFIRMVQRCTAADCQPVFAAAPAELEEQFRRAAPIEARSVRFLPDLDRALEHCEDALLAREQCRLDALNKDGGHGGLFDLAVDDTLRHLEEEERFEALVERLEPQLVHKTLKAGDALVRQGELLDGAYLLVSGQAEELRHGPEAEPKRLRSLVPGSVAGRIATPQELAAPGDIVARTDCRFAFLSMQSLRELETTDAQAALAFHRLYSGRLEARLGDLAQRRAEAETGNKAETDDPA
ncbi:SulP family inorganic anion transporter [Humidesulfovibrio sp.]